MAKRLLVVGATSAIAEQCMRLWGKQYDIDELVVIGRDNNKIEAVLQDLHARYPQIKTESHILSDFCDAEAVRQLIGQLAEKPIDMALIAHGLLGEQIESQTDFQLLQQVIDVNAASVSFFAEAIVSAMINQGQGTLGVISSIAGDKARKRNYHYGAAKAFVSFFCQGLQHRLADTDIRVCLITPGPTRTPMTSAMYDKKLASVSIVARDIVNGMAKGKRFIYTPWKWRYIMFILRHLPWFVFKRIDI